MVHDPLVDPRTEDTIVFELLRSVPGSATADVLGLATFRGGASKVEAEGDVGIAVRELLQQPYVDRLQADERPRGYRRTGRGTVDMLVPGMPEHFIARLRGLWLAYPDGSVITARETTQLPNAPIIAVSEPGPPVRDAARRRQTLAESDRILNARPLVHSNPPPPATRAGAEPLHRTDCGWLT